MPERIQRRRTRGWRLPSGAVNVCRPTMWGNPYAVGSCDVIAHDPEGRHWHVYDQSGNDLAQSPTKEAAVWLAVEWFERDLLAGKLGYTVFDVRDQLAGKDLACWCPPGQRCHAGVLLRIANCTHCWCEDPDECCYCSPLDTNPLYNHRPCVDDPDAEEDCYGDDEPSRRIETIATTGGLL